MKLVLFSGTHPRHLFVNQQIIKHFDDVLVVIMQRESLSPQAPDYVAEHDRRLFDFHFNKRAEVERHSYGDLHHEMVFKECRTLYVSPDQLNSPKITKNVSDFNADIAFIFGVDLIKGPLLEILPENKINLHLGLSPWYKGAATLFWPFYFLQPQYSGVTFHQISIGADAGAIVHQAVPELTAGDGIHTVGAKCVLQAADDVNIILNIWKQTGFVPQSLQKNSGKLWLERDFKASHLRVIYDLYNDRIVDEFLGGNLDQNRPKLVSYFEQYAALENHE